MWNPQNSKPRFELCCNVFLIRADYICVSSHLTIPNFRSQPLKSLLDDDPCTLLPSPLFTYTNLLYRDSQCHLSEIDLLMQQGTLLELLHPVLQHHGYTCFYLHTCSKALLNAHGLLMSSLLLRSQNEEANFRHGWVLRAKYLSSSSIDSYFTKGHVYQYCTHF